MNPLTKRPSVLTLAGLALLLPPAALAGHAQESPPAFTGCGPLAPEDRRHLLQDKFTPLKTARQIPASVRKLFNEDGGARYGIADPGAPYQDTDVVMGPKRLPYQRLVLAANSPHYSLIYVEHGGFSPGQDVFLYRSAKGRTPLAWEARLTPTTQHLNLSQLRDLVQRWNPPKPILTR